MDRELWSQLSPAMFDVARTFPKTTRHTYDTHRIVRVYLWAVLHDRPISWATQLRHWSKTMRPSSLPDQSTMSRRLRHEETQRFLHHLAQRIAGPWRPTLLKALDGKALLVPAHSTDPNATYGWGTGGRGKGYKLHAIWGSRSIPEVWSVRPLNESEVNVAYHLMPHLCDEGYLLADANYDRNRLFDRAACYGHQLVAQRKHPFKGLGHRHHSTSRLRSVDLLEGPGDFGRSLYPQRKAIERNFGGLVSFGGGMQSLPAWVRTLPRVTLFVHAKLIINAARLRRNDA